MDHEREARRRKAIRLADWCRSMGFTADIVINTMTPVIREQACKDAGVNVASAQTWELVVGLLGAHAAIDRIPDPDLPHKGETMEEHFARVPATWPVRPGTDDEKYGPIARNN